MPPYDASSLFRLVRPHSIKAAIDAAAEDARGALREALGEVVVATHFGSLDRYSWFGQRVAPLAVGTRQMLDAGGRRRVLHERLAAQLYRCFYQPGRATPAALLDEVEGSPPEDKALRARLRGELDSLRPARSPRRLPERPGFLLEGHDVLAWGDAPVRRCYFNVHSDDACALLRALLPRATRSGRPFLLKLPHEARGYARADGVVLYVHRADTARWLRVLAGTLGAVGDRLRPAVPALTLPLAAGLGLADEPPTQESFGTHRTRVLATGLLRAKDTRCTDVERRVAVVFAALEEAGIRVTAPYLAADAAPPCAPFALTREARPSHAAQSNHIVQSTLLAQITQTDLFAQNLLTPGTGTPAGRARGRERASPVGPDPLAAATALGRALVDAALWAGDRCSWLGRPPVARRGTAPPEVRWQPVGGDLYLGTAGIARFLAALGAATGDRPVRRAAAGALRHAAWDAERLLRANELGLYSGAAGVALALLACEPRSDEAHAGARGLAHELLRRLERFSAAGAPPRSSPPREGLDLLDGLAGILLALDTLGERLGEPSLRRGALAAAERLCRRVRALARAAPGALSPGMAHGAAGLAYALDWLAARAARPSLARTARLLRDTQAARFDAEVGGWPDPRTAARGWRADEAVSWCPVSWCLGAGGIVLAQCGDSASVQQVPAPAPPEPKVRAQLLAAAATVAGALERALALPATPPSLCHGLGGLVETLALLPSWLRPRTAPLDAGVARLAREVGTPSRAERFVAGAPGVMLGAAGAGALLLRQAGVVDWSPLVPQQLGGG